MYGNVGGIIFVRLLLLISKSTQRLNEKGSKTFTVAETGENISIIALHNRTRKKRHAALSIP